MSETIKGEIVTAIPRGPLVREEQIPLSRNPAAVYLAGLAEGSRRTMRWALDNVAELLTGGRCDALGIDWTAVRFQHVAAVRSALIEEYAASTVNKHLSGIKGTLEAAYKLGQIGGEQYRKATDVKSIKSEAEPAGRMLSAEEIGTLLRACTDDPSPAGARDAAMIALWAVAGPRRAEIVKLDLRDYNPETGAVKVRKAKGNKDRTIYIANEARQAMGDWLAIRGAIEGPLFVPVHQSGRMRVSRMTPQAVYDILQKRAAEAGVVNVSPHDLRRTAISNLIEATDLSTAQKIAGHADPKTTTRYDRRGERAKREAAAKLRLNYEGFR